MQYGKIAGVKKPVSRVVQGTTMIGSDLDPTQSFALLDQVYQLGCSTIDTAHVYSAGNSERVQAADDYAHANGLEPFVASSPQFSLAESLDEPWPLCISISGSAGAAAREWYARTQMPLFIWSPLASGFFSGRFRRDNLHLFGAREWDEVAVRTYASEANFQRLDRANLLADKKGLTAAQVALAYVMNQPMNVFAVVGPHSAEKFEANIQASEVKLTPEEMDWLDLRTDRR